MRPGLASTRLRWAAGAAAALAYAAVTHTLMTHAQDSPWAVALGVGPVAVLGIAALWRSGQRTVAVLCMAAALLLAAQALRGQPLPSRWLYLAQHAGIHFALAVWFGGTLRAGTQPMISALAQRVHGSLSPAMAAYTRNVTLAWTLYFGGMSATSLVLFFAGDFSHWSLLANLLTPVFTTAMFVGEYLLRYRLHPEFERVTLHTAVRAWRSGRAAASRADAGAIDR
jgi:uncharacterized membrane protein